ncbi:MAG: M56 family metallopeptidase [Bacteroidota bacterium]
MEFIYNLIPENILNALGWTVLHSLWQAFIVALLLAAYLLFWQKTNAQKRYWAGCTAMGCTLLFSVVTFFVLLKDQEAAGGLASELINTQGHFSGQLILADPTTPFADYFNNNMPLIVSAWLLGMVFFMLKTMGSLLYIQRLKTRHLNTVPQQWHILKNRLQATLGISQDIKLTASALVKVPMVVGWLKPVILMPIAAINQLTTEQVEAILAHELAHVARYDYFINILQTIVEALFYFNPAVWWISSRIRIERENCCDDMAVATCGNSIAYAKALVSLQEMHQAQPMLALSFSKNKNQLLSRIQRILQSPDKKSNAMEKITATVLLLVTVLLLSVQAQNTPSTPSSEKEPFFKDVPAFAAPTDTIPKSDKLELKPTDETIKVLKKNGDVVEMKFNDSELQKVRINGVEKPVDGYEKFLENTEADDIEVIHVFKGNHEKRELPNGDFRYNKNNGGEEIDVKIKDREIKYLEIDGKVIDQSDYYKYEDLVIDLVNDLPPPPPPPPVPFDLAAPAPPAAPVPPGAVSPASPAAPPAPVVPDVPSAVPSPPAPPAPPAGKRTITTKKNGKGMTIIIENADGADPVEIEIENSRKGNVTINGNEIKGMKDGDETVIVEKVESTGAIRRYYDQASDRLFWFPNGEEIAEIPFPEIAEEPNIFFERKSWPEHLLDKNDIDYYRDLEIEKGEMPERFRGLWLKSDGDDGEEEVHELLLPKGNQYFELLREGDQHENELLLRRYEQEAQQHQLFQENAARAQQLLLELKERERSLNEKDRKNLKLERERIIEELNKNKKLYLKHNDRRMLQREEAIQKLHQKMEAEQKALAELSKLQRLNAVGQMSKSIQKNKEYLERLERQSYLIEGRAKRALIDDSRRAQ